jgi:transposase-like protein
MALSKYSMDEKITHVELWEESGLSKQAYSKESDLSYKTFSNWASRFGKKKSPSVTRKSSKENSFIPVKIKPLPLLSKEVTSSNIEIIYPNGIKVICPLEIKMELLTGLLNLR